MAGRVLIYGGAGGIGAALARRLAAAGHELHLVGRTAGRLAAVAAETGASLTVADILDPDTPARVAAEAGVITGLAYAIGSITLKPAPRVTAADAEQDFRLNAWGALAAVQAALPALRQAAAPAILLFSTVAVQQGFANHASIAMAKGAVEGLTRALAAEFAPKIRVNCIAPSLTDTPLASSLISNDKMREAIAALHPLQRIGTPDDIAGLAALLLSPDAGWVTGQVIGIDGGRARLRTKG